MMKITEVAHLNYFGEVLLNNFIYKSIKKAESFNSAQDFILDQAAYCLTI